MDELALSRLFNDFLERLERVLSEGADKIREAVSPSAESDLIAVDALRSLREIGEDVAKIRDAVEDLGAP